MKKIVFLLSLVFICSAMQVSAMKRAHEQITTSIEATDSARTVPSLPDDMIIRIGALCDPQTRTALALSHTLFNKLTSIRNTEDQIAIDKADRLYYLFYGCIHDLKNLVTNALRMFDVEKKYTETIHDKNNNTIKEKTCYPEKKILNKAHHYIKQMTQSDATKLLPHYPEQKTNFEESIFEFIGNNDDSALFELCIKNPAWNNHDTDGNWWLDFALCNHEFDNETLAMFKSLLIHNRYNKVRRIIHPAATKLLIDYHNDINRYDDKERTLLHKHTSKKWEYDIDSYCFKTRKALLTHPNIDINAQDSKGNTPLHKAVYARALKTVKLLIADPAINIDIKNKENDTPLTAALKMPDYHEEGSWHTTRTKNYWEQALEECKKSNPDRRQRWRELLIQEIENINQEITCKHAIIAQLLLAHGIINNIQYYTAKHAKNPLEEFSEVAL